MTRLVEVYRKPYSICMDSGPEMNSEKYIEWAKSKELF